MAIYVFKMKTFSRNAGSRGSRATSAAAYRAGERIRDARTGASYDHRHRSDVLHKEIVLPRELAARGAQMDWARDRATLWNAAERAETRGNARVAREFTLALPHELDGSSRVRLAQTYAQALAERYRTAVDLVIHAPRGDARNYHAHLLTTTRELTPQGLGRKAALELSGSERYRRGLARWADERSWLRGHWAEVTNQALREAGLQMRVSHLPPATPDPTRPARLPLAAYHMEREGRRSFLAERIRARHRAQLERAQTLRAGLQSAPAARSAGLEPTAAAAGVGSTVGAAVTPPVPERSWLQHVQARAQAAWLALREGMGMRTADARPSGQAQRPDTAAARPLPAVAEPQPQHAPLAQHTPDLRPEAIRAWLEYRERAASQAAPGAQAGRQHQQEQRLGAETELSRSRGNDYDLSL